MKYRKKPVVIEAVQFNATEKSVLEIMDLIRGDSMGVSAICFENGVAYIPTLEGTMQASQGDFIIKGVKGEIYPCKPDIFKQTYEEVED